MVRDNEDISFGDRVKLTGTVHGTNGTHGHIVEVTGWSSGGDNNKWFGVKCETCDDPFNDHQLISANNPHGNDAGSYKGRYTGEIVGKAGKTRQKRNSYTTLDDPNNLWIGEPMASGWSVEDKKHRMAVGEITNDGAYVGYMIDHPHGQIQPSWLFHTPEQLDELITALQYARLAIDKPDLRTKE